MGGVFRSVTTIGCLLAGLAGTQTARGEPLQRYEFSELHMGMEFKLIFYAPSQPAANTAAAAAYARIAELDQCLSDYLPESELNRLTATAGTGQNVPVSDDLWTVLRTAQELAEATDGAFDVTVGPLTKLWRRARRQKEMPSAERLAEALRATGYVHLSLDAEAQTAALSREGMRLDLGGIAVGYACDEAQRVLQAAGITSALIDGSGDFVVGDPPPGEAGWRLALAPGEDGAPRAVLLLSHCAVTTSGDAFQHVEIDGVRYSHIVDPHTGLGLTDQISATVVAPSGIQADSLATTLCVLGPERGLQFIESMPHTEGLLLRNGPDGPQTFASPGFAELPQETVNADAP